MSFTTKFNGLSNAGEIAQTHFSNRVDTATDHINRLQSTKDYSTNEKRQFAVTGAASTKKGIETEIQGLLNSVNDRQIKLSQDTKTAISCDWDKSTQAIIAIELAKDGKRAIDSLTDRNLLASLSSFPEKITNLSADTIANARDSYIEINHPEIALVKKQVRSDLLLVDKMLEVNDTLASKYQGFSSASVEDLNI